MASAVLLSFLLHSDRVQADGCPPPSFAEARNFPASGCAVSVAVGDFNGDGKNDLALGTIFPFDCCTFNVPVLLGNGDGTFQSALNNYAGPNPSTVAVGDFNGDGKLELVVANQSFSNVFSVLLGNGDGTFQLAASFGVNWSVVENRDRKRTVFDLNRKENDVGAGTQSLKTSKRISLSRYER